MKIITLTLNPTYDIHYEVKDFEPFKENYAQEVIRGIGGKGINITRALSSNNIKSKAYVVLGKYNSQNFIDEVEKENLDFNPIFTDGFIRENITIHSPDMPETRISLDNFSISEHILCQIEETLSLEIDFDTVLAFSGRLPKGISADCAVDFLIRLKEKGAKISVDSNSFDITHLYKLSPWLIKPNEQEIETLIGKKVETEFQAYDAAKLFYEKGIENVLISMGGKGALLAGKGFSFYAKPPVIKPLSTTGAGDSSIAGFLSAVIYTDDKKEQLRSAVAYGSAACLTKGTNPPMPDVIKKMKEQITFLN